MQRMSMREKTTAAVFGLVVVLSSLTLYGHLTPGQSWGGDFAAYILQARSIAQGSMQAYVDANRFTIEHSSLPMGPIAYPWGLPLLLAPLYAAFGFRLLVLKSVPAISFFLFLLVLWFAFRKSHSAGWFLCLVCLFAFNPMLLAFSDYIMSDLPFLFFSTLSVALMQRVLVGRRSIMSPRLDPMLVGVAMAMAYLTRTNGLLLPVTYAVCQSLVLVRRRYWGEHVPAEGESGRWAPDSAIAPGGGAGWIAGPVWVPYGVFFGVAMVAMWFLPDGGGSHAALLNDVSMATVRRHLSFYMEVLSAFYAGIPHRRLLYGATLAIAIAGAFRRYRSDYPAMLYSALTLLLYVVWPVRQGFRFLFPLLPFYLSFVVSGLEAFCQGGRAVEQRIRTLLCAIPVVLVIAVFGMNTIRTAYRNYSGDSTIHYGPFAVASLDMFDMISKQTAPDSVIVFFKPRVMRLMTGRPAIMANCVDDIEQGDYLCVYLREKTYAQLSGSDVQYLVAQRKAWKIFENVDFAVYRLHPAKHRIGAQR